MFCYINDTAYDDFLMILQIIYQKARYQGKEGVTEDQSLQESKQ
jgi:hypothetical protein